MSVEFKSGDSSDLATVDPTSKAIRVTSYNSDGVEGTREIPISIAVASISAEDDDIISSLNVSDYKFISLQLTGTWVGTVSFQGSNDNGTFYNIVSQDATTIGSPFSASVTANALVRIPVLFKYLRIRCTAYTSGDIDGTAFGHREENTLSSVGQIGEVTLADETTKVIGTVNVASSQSHAQGTINAADTSVAAPAGDGVMMSGTPSAGSTIVIVAVAEDSAWVVDLTGTLGGATFHFEGSSSSTDGVDGNWTTINGRQTGVVNTFLDSKTTAAGFFRGTLAGMNYFRVRATGGVGISATVHIRVGKGSGSVFLNASIPVGDNVIGSVDDVAKLGGAAVSMDTGVRDAGTQRVTLATDDTVTLAGDVVLAAGSELIGTVRILPGNTSTPIYQKFISATGTNSTVVKSSAANLSILHIVNGAATLRYFKLYNKSSAPVVGTDVPLITITLSPNSASNFTLPGLSGIDFSVGLSFACLLGVADSSTAPFTVAGEVTAMISYT
jgi:hypothetical protein